MRVLTNAKCDAAWTATDEYDLDPAKQLCAGYETALIGTCAVSYLFHRILSQSVLTVHVYCDNGL